MKKLLLLFIALPIIALGQEEKIINYDDIIIVDEIAHLKQDMTLANGKVRGWHENGQLQFEMTFKDGKIDGVGKSWHDNGQLRAEGTMKDGKFDGIVKSDI